VALGLRHVRAEGAEGAELGAAEVDDALRANGSFKEPFPATAATAIAPDASVAVASKTTAREVSWAWL
jgi:hypothetical protein